MKFQTLNRKLHYWGAAVVAIPVLLIIVTGLLLQLKKQSTWVQPPEQRGSGSEPGVALARVLELCRAIPEAGVQSWADISRVDLRPGKGILKVITRNQWEVQIDAQTAQVLQTAYRRSDIIEALHDGSWFHPWTKLGVFLPSGIILLLLWVSGMWLFFVPFLARRRRAKSSGTVRSSNLHAVPATPGETRYAADVIASATEDPTVDQPAASPSAFTIIELLVVIAIIGVLSSILLPALAQAKSKAIGVSCLANVRQLSLGVMMYVDDHESTFPPSADYSLPANDPDRIWTSKVLPYIESQQVFSCPVDAHRAFPTNWAVRGLGTIGYTTATAYDPADVEGFTTFLRAETIESPSQTPLFADTPGGLTSAKYRGFTFDPYNGDANPSDPRMGTPLVSDRDLVQELSSLAPAALKPVFARHNGAANVMHADGHAQNFTVTQIRAQTASLQWRFRLKPAASAPAL